jgi:hypothetical protein
MTIYSISEDTILSIKSRFCDFIKNTYNTKCIDNQLKHSQPVYPHSCYQNKLIDCYNKIEILEKRINSLHKYIKTSNYIIIAKFHLFPVSNLSTFEDTLVSWKTIIHNLFFEVNLPLTWIIRCIKYNIKHSNSSVVFVYLISSTVQKFVRNKLKNHIQEKYDNNISVQ